MRNILISAMLQSQQAWLTELKNPGSFEALVKASKQAQKFIAHCEKSKKTSLRNELTTGGNYLTLIGPEGDFPPAEIDAALDNDFKAITLGQSRLRTETAALEACFEVNFLNRV